jgi:hypothetical protein
MSKSNYWNRAARDYPAEIKQITRSSVMCRMYVTFTKPYKISFSFRSHLIKYNGKYVGYEVFFIYDTVGNSTERKEWLISHNKL